MVIDVGMDRDENGKLCGDVDFESVEQRYQPNTCSGRCRSNDSYYVVGKLFKKCRAK